MFYLIYKITNKINGKYYIGAHKTKILDDGYMGSGKYLNRAIKKHGIDNFQKEIICYCSSQEEMYQKEYELVELNENTYNLKLGGLGGWDHIGPDHHTHRVEHMTKMSHARLEKVKNDPEFDKSIRKKISLKVRRKYDTDKIYKEKIVNHITQIWWGRKHSEESKKKMSLSAQGKQDGEKNSQFGTMWITNEIEDKKVKKTDSLPEGWRKGRKKIGAVP